MLALCSVYANAACVMDVGCCCIVDNAVYPYASCSVAAVADAACAACAVAFHLGI